MVGLISVLALRPSQLRDTGRDGFVGLRGGVAVTVAVAVGAAFSVEMVGTAPLDLVDRWPGRR